MALLGSLAPLRSQFSVSAAPIDFAQQPLRVSRGGKAPRCSPGQHRPFPQHLLRRLSSSSRPPTPCLPSLVPATTRTYRGRHAAAGSARSEAEPGLGHPPAPSSLPLPPPARCPRRDPAHCGPLRPPPRPGGRDLPPGQGDPASAPKRPPASLSSERACGAVRRPPLLLRSQALSSSALPSAPLRSPRRSPPCASRQRPRLPRAPGAGQRLQPERRGVGSCGAGAEPSPLGRGRGAGRLSSHAPGRQAGLGAPWGQPLSLAFGAWQRACWRRRARAPGEEGREEEEGAARAKGTWLLGSLHSPKRMLKCRVPEGGI
ncbi:uncharacterized protein isoform X2 [Macaca fascicularis]|uniref:uncharacterized protein isoform X2 n=1 Tax=Macaca fascicularis TaxID=9541 RepID=UPI003D15A43F